MARALLPLFRHVFSKVTPMKPHHLRVLVVLASAPGLMGTVAAAIAQAYPSKPIRLVVPYPPGAGTDILARTVGQRLADSMGQQVVIDNRPGAGGTIGTEIVAKSQGDGYTLLLGPTSHAINPSIYSRLPYDTLKDFAPVSTVASATIVLVVHPSLPVATVKELIAHAKSKPGQLAVGSSGNGTVFHLAGELFKQAAGIDLTHVPYKGGSPAITALIGGQINVLFETMLALQAHIKAGRAKPLAVAGAQRSAVMPELPTMVESGFPAIVAENWYGLYVPASTSRDIIIKLNAEVVKALKTPDMKDRLAGQGAEIVADTPAQLATFLKSEMSKWAKVVKESGARIE